MNNDTFVEPPCVLLLSIWFRVWNPGFVKYLKMRSSEVHNITLFLIRKKSRNFRATGYGLHSNAFRTTQSAHSAMWFWCLGGWLCKQLYSFICLTDLSISISISITPIIIHSFTTRRSVSLVFAAAEEGDFRSLGPSGGSVVVVGVVVVVAVVGRGQR